jgi:general secretion pathway protein L
MSALNSASVTGFFSWWFQELRDLVPGSLADGKRDAPRIVLNVEPEGALRFVEASGRKSPGATPPPAGSVPATQMVSWLKTLTKARSANAPVGLRLPYASCFVRRVDLPAGARRDYARLLTLEMERSTPFKSKDVLTAYEIDGDAATQGFTQVRHFIVKRKGVDEIKSMIESLGFEITRVDCTDETSTHPLPLNFLANSFESDAARPSGSGWSQALVLVCLGLAALGIHMYVDAHQRALAELQVQTAKLKTDAQAQKDAITRAQAGLVEFRNFVKLKSEVVLKAALLEELTRLLPQTDWISDLKIDGATVELSGFAASAAALVPLIERSKYFVDASSAGSLAIDPQEEKERFSIRARLRGTPSDDQGAAR